MMIFSTTCGMGLKGASSMWLNWEDRGYAESLSALEWMRDNSVPVKAAGRMNPGELKGRFTRGVIVEKEKPEFIAAYDELAERMSADEAAIANYHRYFPRPPGIMIGEKTPEYLSSPWVAPMMISWPAGFCS